MVLVGSAAGLQLAWKEPLEGLEFAFLVVFRAGALFSTYQTDPLAVSPCAEGLEPLSYGVTCGHVSKRGGAYIGIVNSHETQEKLAGDG